MFRVTLVGLAVLTCLVARADVSFRRAGKSLVLTGNAYEARFSAENGAIISISDLSVGHDVIVGQAGGELWRATFRDGTRASAGDAQFSQRWDEGTRTLRLQYTGEPVGIDVAVRGRDEGFDVTATVRNPGQVLLTLELPRELEFAADRVRLFTFPHDLGLGLTRKWFLRQDPKDARSWGTATMGPANLVSLVGEGCELRPDADDAVTLNVTDAGREWLGGALAAAIERGRAVVNRPPEGKAYDVSLIDSPNGSYVPGYQLGGWGWLFRFCGAHTEAKVMLPVVAQICDHIYSTPRPKGREVAPPPGLAQEAPPKIVGVISFAGAPPKGGWTDVSVQEWLSGLSRMGPVRRNRWRIEELASPQAVMDALSHPLEYVCIINPYGEWFPCGSVDAAPAMIDAIRRFVRSGGVWFETGGYSFYYAMQPKAFQSISGPYPSLFADIVHLDSEDGRFALCGIQDQNSIFVPATLAAAGTERDGRPVGVYSHKFNTYVKPGDEWTAPTLRFVVGIGLKEAARRYTADNAYHRALKDKMPPDVLEKFKRSVLVKSVGGTFVDQTKALANLPSPCIFHQPGYMLGGFDKQYPDFLPPNPAKGTMEELRAVYDRAHELGILMMPYLNPTWWCDDPPSPSLKKYGNVALLRDLDGTIPVERYASNWGYSLTASHPVAKEIDARNMRLFTEDLPSDIIFQDQVGARSWKYDMNPAALAPYGYTQAMIDIAKTDCEIAPLSTECGFDRIVDYEAQFCGLTWSLVPTPGGPAWRTFYRERYPPGTWQVSPIALYIAHDKVAFTHHDLGQPIRGNADLSWSLALGYQMIDFISPTAVREGTRQLEWLRWLDALQKQVCCRYMDAPLDDFRYLSASVTQSRFDDITIISNQGEEPYRVEKGVEIAPRGFYATGPNGLLAGIFTELSGRRYDEELWLVTSSRDRARDVWVYGGVQQDVPLPLPAGWPEKARPQAVALAADGEAPVKAKREGDDIVLRAAPRGAHGPARVIPPWAEGRPPQDWAHPPTKIGVIDLEPDPGRIGWADMNGGDWVEAFKQSPLVRDGKLSIQRLTDVASLQRACAAGVREYLTIINPYGEYFPVESPKRHTDTLDAVSKYLASGGTWWETGGYGLFYPLHPRREKGKIVEWQRTGQGIGGWQRVMGFGLEMLPVEEPPSTVTVTPLGRQVLGEEVAHRIEGLQAIVNRPPPKDVFAGTLVAAPAGAYVAGHQGPGWGWLFHVGGFENRDIVAPCALAVTEWVYTHPPVIVQTDGVRTMTHYRVRAGR